jgi:hypothetical protein
MINIPDGYGIASNIPDDFTIRIKGRGWKLFGMNFASDYEYLVSADNKFGKLVLRFSNSLSENSWLTSDIQIIDFSPTTFELKIEKLLTKKVKIVPLIELDYKDGFGLASDIKFIPDSVTVKGAESIINNLDAVTTDLQRFENLESNVSDYINLKTIPKINFATNNLKIVFDVQKIVEKEFSNLEVKVLDLPSDRDVLLLPDKLSASLRGGINIISKIQPNEIRLFIDYSELVADTLGSIMPAYDVPPHSQLVYTKPDRIRYIIKKY